MARWLIVGLLAAAVVVGCRTEPKTDSSPPLPSEPAVATPGQAQTPANVEPSRAASSPAAARGEGECPYAKSQGQYAEGQPSCAGHGSCGKDQRAGDEPCPCKAKGGECPHQAAGDKPSCSGGEGCGCDGKQADEAADPQARYQPSCPYLRELHGAQSRTLGARAANAVRL
jgi:hypothetical protein